jgi:hypothetical protein
MPETYREFNGKKYKLFAKADYKANAKRDARILKNRGYNTRIVSFKAKDHAGRKLTGYAIYGRKK